jgi:hypothetical protein
MGKQSEAAAGGGRLRAGGRLPAPWLMTFNNGRRDSFSTGARHVVHHIVYRCSAPHPPHSVTVLATSSTMFKPRCQSRCWPDYSKEGCFKIC